MEDEMINLARRMVNIATEQHLSKIVRDDTEATHTVNSSLLADGSWVNIELKMRKFSTFEEAEAAMDNLMGVY